MFRTRGLKDNRHNRITVLNVRNCLTKVFSYFCLSSCSLFRLRSPNTRSRSHSNKTCIFFCSGASLSPLGSLEEHEFFGEVLLGIKQVIQTHMKEIQVKFQDKFFNLELEVKKRDDIISKLQNRIQELEQDQQQQADVEHLAEMQQTSQQQQRGSSGSGTSRSSDELPFMVSRFFSSIEFLYVKIILSF